MRLGKPRRAKKMRAVAGGFTVAAVVAGAGARGDEAATSRAVSREEKKKRKMVRRRRRRRMPMIRTTCSKMLMLPPPVLLSDELEYSSTIRAGAAHGACFRPVSHGITKGKQAVLLSLVTNSFERYDAATSRVDSDGIHSTKSLVLDNAWSQERCTSRSGE